MNEKCPFANNKKYRFFFSTSLSQQNKLVIFDNLLLFLLSDKMMIRGEENSQEKLCHNLVRIENNCSRRNKLYNKHIRNTVGVCNRDGMRQRLVMQGHHSWLAAAAVVAADCARLLQETRTDEGDRERERKKGRSVLCRGRCYKSMAGSYFTFALALKFTSCF